MRVLPWVVGLALLVPIHRSALAQEPTAAPAEVPQVASSGRSPEEVDAFRKAQERFSSRMTELENDTRGYIDETEARERQKLSAGYDSLISQLEDSERSQRKLAMQRMEDFLVRYPAAEYASHVRFRLADLHWEQAREQWLAASSEYYALEEKLLKEDRADELPPPPTMDLSKPVALYERIIAENEALPPEQQYEFLDGSYYSLGFVYKEENSQQYDEAKAIAAFTRLIEVRPDSALTDDAHLNLGNFKFENNDFDGAIAEYRIVYNKGPEGKLYGESMYQLAWAYYKLNQYDKPRLTDPPEATALAMFTKLLDWSETEFQKTGRRSDYAPDAVKYMAFSFADIADRPPPRDPTEVAEKYFATVGPRDYEWDVFVALGEALTQYGRFDQSVNVYRKLQRDERWKLKPDNPEYQMQIVKLLASGAYQDLAASAAARIELTEKYNDQSEWWYANRHNPEALATARRYIEESLADVAIEYRKNAEQDGTPQAYKLAADKFQEYLDKFPISDDFFQMQWYMADTLYLAKEYERAAAEYVSLTKSGKHHPYGDGAVYQTMRCRQEIASAKWGPPGQLPQGAAVARKYTSEWNKEVTVYALSDEHKAYVASVDAVLSHKFSTAADEGQADWASTTEKNRLAFMYQPGQVLFFHNEFPEARKRLLAVIDFAPASVEASYAAGLIVDSYLAEGDLANVRASTTVFRQKLKLSPEQAKVFESANEGAAFKQAMALIETGEREGAAEAFLAFIEEFPKSENRNLALYNAATSYDVIGRAEDANGLYEQYVNTYPKDERSAGLYFRIAANYESTFDLSKAVDYYNRLLTNFPKDTNAPDAYYNQAFLKVGLGDHAGAAKGFEEYARLYPDRLDVEEVHFQAGEQYERVSSTKGIEFYERYLDKYGTKNPDHALTAEYKLSMLYRKAGNTKKADAWLDRILKDFDGIVEAGRAAELKNEGRNYAAESAFRSVKAEYDALVKEPKLPSDPEKAAKLLADKEVAVEKFREQSLAMAGRYADFEYTTAVLYLRAQTLLYYAGFGPQIQQCPAGFNDDECMAYDEAITPIIDKFNLVFEKGKTELVKLTELAREKKQHSDWISKAFETLNDLDPKSFPAEKQEIRGGTDSSVYPEVRPVTMDPPKKGQ